VNDAIADLVRRRRKGEVAGIPSIRSSHPTAIEATLRHSRFRRDDRSRASFLQQAPMPARPPSRAPKSGRELNATPRF